MLIKKFLPLILVALALTGCGKDQYAIEREYYFVQKQANAVLTNPEATPPNELDQIVSKLNSFLAKYPKTNIAVESQFTIARLYAATKNYDQAHAQLEKVGELFIDSMIVRSDAVFMRGAIYEDAKDWPSALAQYKKIMQIYPETPRGMQMPFYIAMRYKAKMQPDKMIEALREAVDHYKTASMKYAGTPLAFQSRMMVAQCYGELKEWDNVVDILENTINDYKGKIRADIVMAQLAGVYYKELKNKPKAVETLNKIIKEFPKTQSSDMAQKLLAQISKEK